MYAVNFVLHLLFSSSYDELGGEGELYLLIKTWMHL